MWSKLIKKPKQVGDSYKHEEKIENNERKKERTHEICLLSSVKYLPSLGGEQFSVPL